MRKALFRPSRGQLELGEREQSDSGMDPETPVARDGQTSATYPRHSPSFPKWAAPRARTALWNVGRVLLSGLVRQT
jgi:hypothetical protein